MALKYPHIWNLSFKGLPLKWKQMQANIFPDSIIDLRFQHIAKEFCLQIAYKNKYSLPLKYVCFLKDRRQSQCKISSYGSFRDLNFILNKKFYQKNFWFQKLYCMALKNSYIYINLFYILQIIVVKVKTNAENTICRTIYASNI